MGLLSLLASAVSRSSNYGSLKSLSRDGDGTVHPVKPIKPRRRSNGSLERIHFHLHAPGLLHLQSGSYLQQQQDQEDEEEWEEK